MLSIYSGDKRIFYRFFIVVWLVGISQLGFAATTATLTGRVTNSLGEILSEVQLTATHVETNQLFRTKTNNLGLYRLPNLPPGYYRLIIRLVGFRTIVKPEIELHVQDVIALNFSMQVGSIITSVTEREGIPIIQAESATLGTTVGPEIMTELPSLTRNPYDFVALTAGATPASVKRGIGFVLNGQRAESGSFLLDGSDNNDSYNSGPGQIIPLDAVQEYRLLTNNFTAEYGRNTGFIANAVTKTGVNEFHGTAYYFLRNSKLAANTFENKSRLFKRPVFNRRQFGGTIGGPLFRDKLFFFGAFEPILVRSTAAISYYVPTPQLLAVSSPGTNTLFKNFPLPTDLSRTDVSTRTVCPFGRPCGSKIGSGFVTIPAFASTSRTGPIDAGAGEPQNTYLSSTRLDYSINPKVTLNLRYSFQNMDQFPTVSQPYSPLLDQPMYLKNQNISLNLTKFWSTNLLTESRLVFSRFFQKRPSLSGESFLSSVITGDEISGAAGSLSIPSGKNGDGGTQNEYQFYQMANWIKGQHNLKFGWGFIHLRDNRTLPDSTLTRHNHGEFFGLQTFVNGLLSSYQLHLDPRGKVPGEPLSPPFFSFDKRRNYRFNDLSGFFQDSWKLTPRLTLSPGIRYEYFGSGHRSGSEKLLDASFYRGTGNDALEQMVNGFLARTINAPGKYQNHFFLPSRKNFGPRLGLAYDLTGKGRTIFRSGIGRFYERLPGFIFENLNPPAFSIAQLAQVPLSQTLFSNPYSVFPDEIISVPPSTITYLDQDLRTAYTWSWNATVEQDLSNQFLISTSYIGSNGIKLYQSINSNRLGSGMLEGRPSERLVNNTAAFIAVGNQGFASYHGLQIKINGHRLQKFGLQYGTNYTWSYSVDNVSSLVGDDRVSGGRGLPLDAFNPNLDRGSSDHDARHRLASHFIWKIPLPNRFREFKDLLLGGWQVSGLLSFQTGQPFSLSDGRVFDREFFDNTRPRLTGNPPDILNGRLMIPDARTPNSFLFLPVNRIRNTDGTCISNAKPFGCQFSVNGPFDGSLGRNTFRRPGTHFQNIALAKNIDLPKIGNFEGMQLQCRAEFYNVFNHSNLYLKALTTNIAAASFNTDIRTRIPGVVATYGAPDRFPQEARQVVLGLKLIF